MIALYKCVCTSFRWVLLPNTTTVNAPICHGLMQLTGDFIIQGKRK